MTYFIDFFLSFLGLVDPGMSKRWCDQKSRSDILMPVLTQRRMLIYRWGRRLLRGRWPIIATLRLGSRRWGKTGGFLVVSGHGKRKGDDMEGDNASRLRRVVCWCWYRRFKHSQFEQLPLFGGPVTSPHPALSFIALHMISLVVWHVHQVSLYLVNY